MYLLQDIFTYSLGIGLTATLAWFLIRQTFKAKSDPSVKDKIQFGEEEE